MKLQEVINQVDTLLKQKEQLIKQKSVLDKKINDIDLKISQSRRSNNNVKTNIDVTNRQAQVPRPNRINTAIR